MADQKLIDNASYKKLFKLE